MVLADISEVAVALKTFNTGSVKLLYKLIFNDDKYDRQSREKLRKFSGFAFGTESIELKDKVTKIRTDFSLSQLVTVANVLRISNEGSANDLTTRIVSSLNDLSILKSNILVESENEITDDEYDEPLIVKNNESVKEGNSSGSEQTGQPPFTNECFMRPNECFMRPNEYFMRPSASFSDFESFVAPFSGTSSESLENWLEIFEDTASLLNLNELQKIIYAKKSMSGRAKLFLDSELKIHSYSKFKELMLSEFGDVSNSADIHEMLAKRKMGHDETVEEYFLYMKQLANRAKIEDSALIKYVINGIRDDVYKKASLYGCENLNEFRIRLKAYEQMKSDENKVRNFRYNKPELRNSGSSDKFRPNYENKNSYANKNRFKNEKIINNEQLYQNKSSRRDVTCFSCGGKTHIARNCPDKNKGNKCFNCSLFGHKSFECPKKGLKPEVSNIIIDANAQIKAPTKFNDLSVNSLIDTGSQVTLLQKHIFDKLKVEKLHSLTTTLGGFGGRRVKPLGYFKSNIEIDALKCIADVYVVEDEVMSNEAIIGLNVLMQGETTISEKGVVVKNKSSETEEINLINVLPVNLTCNESEINVGPSVPSQIKNDIQNLVSNYEPRKTKTTNIQMKIIAKNDESVSHQPRRLPFTEKKIVETQVTEWLKSGIIENSSSEYSSPVVIVKKKDGTPRVCIDYRKLNKIIVKDRFPLPLIEDILDRLQGARVFSTIDLRNGFFHVDVEEGSRKYTSFVTHEGQYHFLKVPFGLSTSPAVFQRFINTIFRPLINDGIVLPYMDDVIILSSSIEEGVSRLKMVLNLASEYGLEINFKKSQFLKERIEFLGYVIEEGKIYPSTLKTQAVLNFPEPKNTKQVQSYLGLTGYFRKFIPQYSIIARPLSDLLKKDRKFTFGDEERNAFVRLKSLLAEKPVLAIYNPAYETKLHTDASLEGYGATLLQKPPDEKPFRVLLDLTDLQLESLKYVWMNVSPQDLKTIAEFKTSISCNINLERVDIDLFVRNGLLLDNETVMILREDDIVKVQYRSQSCSNFKYTENSVKESRQSSSKRNNENHGDLSSDVKRYKLDSKILIQENENINIDGRNRKQKKRKKYPACSEIPFHQPTTSKINDCSVKKISKKKDEKQKTLETYNLRRRTAQPYKVGDLVAIKRTQFGPNLKLKAKFFGPYKIIKVKGGDTYDVSKIGYHEGPQCTTTCAEYLKKWTGFSQ